MFNVFGHQCYYVILYYSCILNCKICLSSLEGNLEFITDYSVMHENAFLLL